MNTSDRKKRIQQILDECMKSQAAGGEAELEKLMAAHPHLMPELGEELDRLRAVKKGGRVLDLPDPIEQSKPTQTLGPASKRVFEPGERIGRYELRSVLGEGGMGVVYLAEQAKPIRRKVALKLIKLGMDTTQVIARFETERQALALMDHPNVAKVFDAGATMGKR